MSIYIEEYFNDDHISLDHTDCGIDYTVHNLEIPTLEFTSQNLYGVIIYDPDLAIYTIEGQFPNLANVKVKYWAANPIIRNYSYSGSGLPYPNPETAYENTPNQGYILLDNNGRFIIKLDSPSGYYVKQGKILLKPHLHLKVLGIENVLTITIADSFPNRSLKNLPDRPNRSTNR